MAIARSAMPNGCGGEYVEACPEDLEPCMSPLNLACRRETIAPFEAWGNDQTQTAGRLRPRAIARSVSSMFRRASGVTASGSSAQRSTETGSWWLTPRTPRKKTVRASGAGNSPCDALGEPRSAFEQKADEGHAISYFRHWHLADVSFLANVRFAPRAVHQEWSLD